MGRGDARRNLCQIPFYILGSGHILSVKFGLEEAFKGIKIDGIELAEPLHPDRRRSQGIGLQLAPFHPSALFLRDKPCIGQNGKVFRDGCQRHREGFGYIGDGHVILKQHRQDRAARGIGQRGENGVERVGCGRGHAGMFAGLCCNRQPFG